MQNFIGSRSLGHVRREQEMQLGQILSKKVGTIDFDFPGAAYYCKPRTGSGGTGNDVGIIPKNTIFFRQTTSPYKYQPLTLLKVLATITDHGGSDTIRFEHSDAYMFGFGRTPVSGDDNIMLWDESAEKWSDFASDSATIRTGALVFESAALATTAVSDLIAVGSGVADMHNWVLFDEEVNLKTTAKPAAISADVIASFIYDGRINAEVITQWRGMSTNLKKAFREKCGRLFADIL